MEAIFPEFLSENKVGDELAKLHALGDIVKPDGYRALIGPGRRILIDDSRSLLLGGGSVWSLPRILRGTVEVSGRIRVVRNDDVTSPGPVFPIQRLEDWVELDQDDMLAWAEKFVRIKLLNEANIEVPEGMTIWLGKKWAPLDQFTGASDVYLARRKAYMYGNAFDEYSLLRLRNCGGGGFKVDAFRPLEKDTARKLQGAIRSAGSPAEKIEYAAVRDGIVEVEVPHPLPSSFSKLLLLGWPSSTFEGDIPWPKKFEFSCLLLPLLSRAFKLFGYEFTEKRGKLHGRS
jgi:hypothetical protein